MMLIHYDHDDCDKDKFKMATHFSHIKKSTLSAIVRATEMKVDMLAKCICNSTPNTVRVN